MQFKWLKTLQGPQLVNYKKNSFGVGNPQKIKLYHPLSNSTSSLCLEGFQEKYRKENALNQRNKLQHIQLSDTTETSWDWLLRSDETNTNSFLAANTQDGFSAHGYNEIHCSISNVVGQFSARDPGYLVQIVGTVDSIEYLNAKMTLNIYLPTGQ